MNKQAECWQIEQAITGGLANWYVADNQADRDKFPVSLDGAQLTTFSSSTCEVTVAAGLGGKLRVVFSPAK